MQKWCPESLVKPAADSARFEALPTGPSASGGRRADVFRPEAGFADREVLLRALSREERAEVLKLLEQDLRREHDEWRRQEEEARQAAAAVQREADLAALAAWQDSLARKLDEAFRSALAVVASRTAELAMLMAQKVVRREVAADPEVLVRSLETVLYKAAAGCLLTVTVHPEDALWLAAAPQLRERLRIGEIKEDRRLERGGCLVKADEVEWDATLTRQITALGEALAAALAIPPDHARDGEHA